MSDSKDEIRKIVQAYYSQPQESLEKVQVKNQKLSVGIPKESESEENRVGLRPEAVRILVNRGVNVLVEAGAGDRAKYTDRQYSDAGAQIAYSPKEVYEGSEIILKILPPTIEELREMPMRKTLISALQIVTLEREYIKLMNEKRLTGIAFELMQDRYGSLPLVRGMSEIAGSTSLLIAAELLSSPNNGKGIILGGVTGVPPSNVVILGGGTVAEFAARTALGLGANVKIFDNSHFKLRRLKYNLNNPHLYTSIIDAETLTDALKVADVVIGAMRPENGRTPCLVTEEMVGMMPENSVIIDVSIDHGGCFETSEPTTLRRPTFTKFGVVHYCVPNIASRVAHTASTAISNIFTPLLSRIATAGGISEYIYSDSRFARGVYCFEGDVTNETIGRKFDFRYKNLALLIAARTGSRL